MALRRVISFAAVAAMVLVLSPRGASAQEGDPAITVQQVHPASTSVHYVVELAADGGEGDPIDGATMTATPTSPDGAAGQPVALQADGDGIYQGTVPLSDSGDWTVTFASTDPEATVTYEQPMPGEVFDASDTTESSPVFPLLFAAAFLLTLAGMGIWALIDRRRDEGAGPGEDVVADPGIDDAADAHLDDVTGDAASSATAADAPDADVERSRAD